MVGLPPRRAPLLQDRPAGFGGHGVDPPDGSSWKMVDGTWRSVSESFKEDFKYRYGRPQTDYERKLPQQEQPGGRGPYSPAELTAMMEDQTGKGALAWGLEGHPRRI